MDNMKKVLVMGGSYFIGKHVVNVLKNDYSVYVLNRGNKPFNDPLVNELICDRNDEEELKKVLSPHAFHYVIDISGYNKSQVTFFLRAFDLSALTKFVFISTSAVYNIDVLTPPLKETDEIGGDTIFSDYAKNKIEAENYLLNTIENDKLVIFRPPYVYGEDNYLLRERLAFYLIEQGLPVYVPKSDNRLSFVYAKDLAQEVKLAFEGVIPAGIYNVGNKHPLSFTEWLNLCSKVMNKKADIVYVDANHPSLELRYFFPFLDYDYMLALDKIKAYSPYETPYEVALKRAYDDYLNLMEPIQLPQKMLDMRERIEKLLKQK
jgi:nucleoside-diphosphate-sugar epimerase